MRDELQRQVRAGGVARDMEVLWKDARRKEGLGVKGEARLMQGGTLPAALALRNCVS